MEELKKLEKIKEKYHHLLCPFSNHKCFLEKCALWSKEQPTGCKIVNLVDVYLVNVRVLSSEEVYEPKVEEFLTGSSEEK